MIQAFLTLLEWFVLTNFFCKGKTDQVDRSQRQLFFVKRKGTFCINYYSIKEN